MPALLLIHALTDACIRVHSLDGERAGCWQHLCSSLQPTLLGCWCAALRYSALNAKHTFQRCLMPSLPCKDLRMLHVEVHASFCVLDAGRGFLHNQQCHS